jgi:hypothetical protein
MRTVSFRVVLLSRDHFLFVSLSCYLSLRLITSFLVAFVAWVCRFLVFHVSAYLLLLDGWSSFVCCWCFYARLYFSCLSMHLWLNYRAFKVARNVLPFFLHELWWWMILMFLFMHKLLTYCDIVYNFDAFDAFSPDTLINIVYNFYDCVLTIICFFGL